MAEAFIESQIYGDRESVQAVTRVNEEKTSKRTMRRPTDSHSGKADTAGKSETYA